MYTSFAHLFPNHFESSMDEEFAGDQAEALHEPAIDDDEFCGDNIVVEPAPLAPNVARRTGSQGNFFLVLICASAVGCFSGILVPPFVSDDLLLEAGIVGVGVARWSLTSLAAATSANGS